MPLRVATAIAWMTGASLVLPVGAGRGTVSANAGAETRQNSSAATESFDALAARAARAREAGQLEEALALYRRALAVRSEWDEGRWYVGTLLYELDRYAEAVDAFVEVLRAQPDHAGALGLKGLCEFRLSRYERALPDLLRADKMGIARSPGIATVVWYHAAALLTRFGDFEVGYNLLRRLAAESTETSQILELFGLNILRMPMLPSDIPPEARDRVMLAGRAGYALAIRHVDTAEQALDELVARYPSTPHVHYARGVFFLTSDGDRALAEFRRELAVSPSHVPARLQIAFELLKRGDAAGARRPAEEAAKLAPDHFATRLALGQTLLESNDVTGAIAELEHAVRLEPSSPQPHFVLARAYARAGREAEAERARAEFVRLQKLPR